MVYLVEKPLQVDVYYILIAIVDVFQGLCNRLVDVLFGAEAVAVFLVSIPVMMGQ